MGSDRKQEEADQKQRQVDRALGSATEKPRKQVRVQIARQEHGLKEQHCRDPNTCGTAECGQDCLSHDRLDGEEEQGTESNGEVEGHAADLLGHTMGRNLNFTNITWGAAAAVRAKAAVD